MRIICLDDENLFGKSFNYSSTQIRIDHSRLSVSNDLKYDAQRDLYDIGAQFIEVHPLNKVLGRKEKD